MSKEIKLRAWNTGVKAMLHFSNPIGIADDSDRYGIFFKADEGKMYIGGSYEIMQYTGLKDKKRTEQYPEGQEVYEGDIVRHKQYIVYGKLDECIGSVTISPTKGTMVGHDSIGKEFEVIGNIYESKEETKC